MVPTPRGKAGGAFMNFEASSPHQEDPVDNCHYAAVLSDVSLTWLECASAVDPDSIHASLTNGLHFYIFLW